MKADPRQFPLTLFPAASRGNSNQAGPFFASSPTMLLSIYERRYDKEIARIGGGRRRGAQVPPRSRAKGWKNPGEKEEKRGQREEQFRALTR